MYILKPTRPHVTDALTGAPMPPEGVVRELLLPPDHYAIRTGDVLCEVSGESVQGSAKREGEAESADTNAQDVKPLDTKPLDIKRKT